MCVETQRIETIAAAYQKVPGATLPVLHEIQRALGFIPPEAISIVADQLNLSRAEVHGVVTFYSDFRTTPGGQHRLQICRGEACQAKGSETLEKAAKAALGIDYHETSADGCFSLEPVYCLGNCGCSPAVRIDDEIVGRVDDSRFQELLTEYRKGSHE